MTRYLRKPFKAVANYLSSGDERQTALSTESTPDGDSVYLDTQLVDIARDKNRNKLGEGAFAKVYEGKYRGQPCAVKVFNEDVLKKQNDIESYLCGLNNPNIIRIFGFWIDPYKDRNALAIVMELCDTSLHEYIKSHKARGMPKRDKLKILHDVTNAMIYLQNEHIVHGDLRSPNVLLVNTRSRVESSDEQPLITAKVADFDLARHVDPETFTRYTTSFADEDYLPPEAIDEEKFKDRKHVRLNFSVDVFCFGPLAIELACMEFPKPVTKVERKKGQVVKVRDEIKRREKYLKKIDFSERIYTDLIVAQCMAERPEERGSFLDLQLIVEAFQKKMQERPDHELLEEQQAKIFDMRRKMEEDTKTLVEQETLKEQLDDMTKSNEELQEKLQQKEKDLTSVTTERDVQKRNHEDSQKSLSECHVKLGQKEQEIKRIQEDFQLIVAEKDKYSRDAVEAKNHLTESKKKADELEQSLHSAKEEKLSLSAGLQKLEESEAEIKQVADQQKVRLQELENQLSKQKEVNKTANRDRLNQKQHLKRAEEECQRLKRYEEQWKKSEARLKEEEEKLRAAEEEKTSLSTRLKEAEESLDDTKARLKEEEEKLRAAEEEKTSLSTRLTKAEESLEDTKVKFDKDSAGKLQGLREKVEEMKAEISKLELEKSQWEEERKGLAKRAPAAAMLTKFIVRRQMSGTIKDLKTDVEGVIEEKVHLQKSNSTLTQTVETHKKEIEDLKAALQHEKDKGERMSKVSEEISSIKKTYDALLEEKKKLEKEKETLEGEKSTLNQSKELLQRELEELRTELAGKQQELSSVQDEVRKLRGNEERSKEMETSLRTEVDKVVHSKGALEDEVKELRASEVKLRETEALLRTEVDKAVHSKGELEDEVEELRASEVKLRETETLLRTEVDKAVRSKGELEGKVKELIANLKKAEKTEATLKGQLDKMSVELEKMKSLKEEAESMQKMSKKEQKNKVKKLEDFKVTAEKELREAKQLNSQMTQQRDVLSREKAQLEDGIRKLRADLQTSEDAKTVLNNKLTETGKSLKDTKSKLEKCEKENEELLRNLDGLQKAKTFVEKELHKVETERDSALETVRELEAKLSTETDALKESEEKWRKSQHLHSKQMKTLGDQCGKMEEQLKDEERMKEQAVQELEEMKSKADALEREKEALEKSTLTLEDELNQRRTEVNRSESIAKELEKQLKDTAKQRDELKQKCEELTRHSEDAKKSLQAEEKKCKRLEETLEQTQKQLEEMQRQQSTKTDDDKSQQIQDLEEEKQHFSKKLQEVNDMVENQKDLISKRENEKEDLQKEINRLNQSNAKLKNDHERELQLADHRANEDMQKLKRKHSNLEDKLRDKANTLHQKQREIEDLSAKVQESQELLEKQKEVEQRMEADCRRLENDLKSEKKCHKETVEEYRTKTALLEDEKGRLLAEMANLEQTGDRLVREKEELEEQLVNMETTIKALIVNRDELSDEKDSLLGTVVDLEEERDNLRSSMADLERVTGELLEEKMCLKKELTEAARRCDDLKEACSDLDEKFSNLEQQHVSSLQINEDEMNSLKEELNETQCKLQEKQTEHDSTLKLSKELQSALDESNECAEELKVRNDHLVGEVEQLRTSECALSAVVNEKEKELTKLTLAVEDYKGKFEGARVQHGKLIEKFEALAIEKEDYQRKCEEFAGVDEKLKLVVSEKEDLEKKSEELKGSLAKYSERIRLLDKKVTERTSEIENLEEERDSLKQALCKSEEKLLKCSADLGRTNGQLVHFKGECERVQVKCDQVQNENVRMHERLLHREKVHKQRISLSEHAVACKQSTIVTLWAESHVDKMLEQVLEGQLQKVTAKLEDMKSELNGREEELTTVTARLAEEVQKCQQLQYQELCLSEELANIEEDLRREREKCARYRDEVSGLENAQMDVVVQKDAIERDFAVLRAKSEQSQKELSHQKELRRRLSVVERDFRQAKDAENQLRAQCEDFKIQNKILVEENAVLRKALEAKAASSLQLQEENMQLKVLKKQEKQIKSQKQTLRQGRKALQQDMEELERKKASLEGKQELLQECNKLTRQSLEDDRKLQIEKFKEFSQEQLIAVDRMCNKIDKGLKQQRKEQQQLFEGIVQGMEAHHTKQCEEQELTVRKLEQRGESVLRRLEHDLHNAKEKEELIGSEVQKVSKPPNLDVKVNSEIFKSLQKFEIVCKLLNCYVPDIVNPTNEGMCESSEELTSTCDLDSFTVFDVCNVQHLQEQFKLPVAVRNFVESLRPLIRGPSIVCSLPFIVFAGDVRFCHLLLATSPFLITAGPKDVLRMEPTLVCVLAQATLTGDIEQKIITCQRKWEHISKGVVFHPTWGEQEPRTSIALKYPTVELPVQLEPVLEQLNLGMARKLHECKPELVRSLLPEYQEECKK